MQYFSLLASLPTPRLFDVPKLSIEKFFSDCSTMVSDKNYMILEHLSLVPGETGPEFRRLAMPHHALEMISPERRMPKDSFDLARRTYHGKSTGIFPPRSLAACYTHWETALRYSILKIRAAKQGNTVNLSDYGLPVFECDAERAAVTAYGTANPLEREKVLDEARWTKLDELTQNMLHPYNFDALCAYLLRLRIAWKWAGRKAETSSANLDAAAQAATGGTDSEPKQTETII